MLLTELREYNPELMVKDRVLAITKSDMLDDQLKNEIEATLPKDIPHLFISSFTQEGIKELKNMLCRIVIYNMVSPIAVVALRTVHMLCGSFLCIAGGIFSFRL